MQTLTTAQAVVSMLEVNGIDTIFCLPGVQNDAFFDALYDRTNAIRPIHGRHEQACAYMALGYAMASGQPSAYVVVPGPGFLNTTATDLAFPVNPSMLDRYLGPDGSLQARIWSCGLGATGPHQVWYDLIEIAVNAPVIPAP